MSQVSLASTFLNDINATTSFSTSHHTNRSEDSFSQRLSHAKKDIRETDRTERLERRESSSLKKKQEQISNEPTQEKDSIPQKDVTKVEQKQEVKGKETCETSEDKVLDTTECTEETNQAEAVTQQILDLVSQVLQMPIQEVQVQLSELGLEAQDLLSEDGFSQFINQALAGGDLETLLSSDVDMKQISALFEQLSDMGTEQSLLMPSENGELVLEAQLPEVQASHEVNKELAPEVPLVDVQENEITASNPIMEEYTAQVNFEKVDKSEEAKLPIQEEHTLNLGAEENLVDSDLGITVPIHHFTTTTFTQSFQTDAGMVSQTTVTKQAVNGQTFIEQIDFKVLGQTKEINIALSPKELGEMNIKIVEQHGVMVAEIKVENEKAKELILQEIHTLKENLEQQGLEVIDVKVDIHQENHQTQMEQERQKSSKRIQDIIAKHFEEQNSDEEEIERPIPSDSEVDYSV